MNVQIISTLPFIDQQPGTSGLRRKTRIFMQPHYLENYVQSIFQAIGGGRGKTFVLGGDGRFFNAEAIQTIVRIAGGNGVGKLIIGRDGLLSTPAASHLIRKNSTHGGLILSASHNPGGIDADFGVKLNVENGGPAPGGLTDRIFEATRTLDRYRLAEALHLDLGKTGTSRHGTMEIEIVDPVTDYLDLMEQLFDFDAIRDLLSSRFTMRFDAMHAVTGPYAHIILEDRLGAPRGTVLNGTPSVDFGKQHPDPNPIWAKSLMDLMMSDAAPDFGAASDGDGDRNMILGRGTYVTPSDGLAILAANAHLAPGYAAGLTGVARSMPTSAASDRVAEALGIGAYEVPTGWKFFGNLLDAGMVSICGEESAGTGSSHMREKDGLWAVLLWLNIIAKRNLWVADIQIDHWQTYGRNYYTRHDFESVDAEKAAALVGELDKKLNDLPGQDFARLTVRTADAFTYVDPVDGSISHGQGIRIHFDDGGRAVFRASGTGAEGTTLRLYLEKFEPRNGNLFKDPQSALRDIRDAAYKIFRIEESFGRAGPTVVT